MLSNTFDRPNDTAPAPALSKVPVLVTLPLPLMTCDEELVTLNRTRSLRGRTFPTFR